MNVYLCHFSSPYVNNRLDRKHTYLKNKLEPELSHVEVWCINQNPQPQNIENKVNVTLVIKN